MRGNGETIHRRNEARRVGTGWEEGVKGVKAWVSHVVYDMLGLAGGILQLEMTQVP